MLPPLREGSNMSEQLPLFDSLDRERQEQENRQLEDARAFMREPVRCLFCKETMPRAVMSFNHGIVFNGWCIKALMYHTRNQGALYTSEANWLQHLSIDPALSRFDQSHWNHDNVDKHYAKHYGECYREGCK